MNVKEVLDKLFEVYGGISGHGKRSCAFAMFPRATQFENVKAVFAFSYEEKTTPERQFFTTEGTPITVIFNEKTGKNFTLPQHSFPMKTYDPVEVDSLLCEVSDALDEIL